MFEFKPGQKYRYAYNFYRSHRAYLITKVSVGRVMAIDITLTLESKEEVYFVDLTRDNTKFYNKLTLLEECSVEESQAEIKAISPSFRLKLL